jgi:hypothetical protein
MKTILLYAAALSVLFCVNVSDVHAQGKTKDLEGAWKCKTPGYQLTAICSGRFFAVAAYDVTNKRFLETYGGSYRIEGDEWVGLFEFHSSNPEVVGSEIRRKIKFGKAGFTVEEDSGNMEFSRLDDGTPGKLAGAWLITGRMREGAMSTMTPGARRTMKILSGTRFQWIAYNVETREFSGTGDGTYTTGKGKYTENIEFFSRDNSRVGASLAFNFKLEDGNWRHQGKSSKGDPIDEVWTKREKIGL